MFCTRLCMQSARRRRNISKISFSSINLFFSTSHLSLLSLLLCCAALLCCFCALLRARTCSYTAVRTAHSTYISICHAFCDVRNMGVYLMQAGCQTAAYSNNPNAKRNNTNQLKNFNNFRSFLPKIHKQNSKMILLARTEKHEEERIFSSSFGIPVPGILVPCVYHKQHDTRYPR